VAYAAFGTSGRWRGTDVGDLHPGGCHSGQHGIGRYGVANSAGYGNDGAGRVIGVPCLVVSFGNIVNFISETVLSGFKVRAGLVIISTQLPETVWTENGAAATFSNRVVQLATDLGQRTCRLSP